MSVASLERKKKRIAMKRNCVKRRSDTEKIYKKATRVKVNKLTTERNEGMRKTIAKMRQAG